MQYEVKKIENKDGYSFIATKDINGKKAIVCLHKYDATSPEITDDIKKEIQIEMDKLNGN